METPNIDDLIEELVDAVEEEARKLTEKLVWGCFDLWTDGTPIPQIRKLMADKGVKTRKINTIIHRLEELISDLRMNQKSSELEDHIARGWALFQKATDDKVKLEIWKQLAVIQGFEKSTLKVKGKFSSDSAVTINVVKPE